jgi:hypothetical protein
VTLPATKPLDGEFWYVLDDANTIMWKPRPRLRGEFYLSWLGQNKNVVGAGLVKMEHGQLLHICTHGTPYYWLQPYEALPITAEALREKQVQGADTMILDYSLAGWELRDQVAPETRALSDVPISTSTLDTLLDQAVRAIVRDFRSEGGPPVSSKVSGLLARTMPAQSLDPLEELLNSLKETLDEPNVVPVLVELVKHDVNVMPGYRQSDLFERLAMEPELPPPNKISRLVLSALYQLAPRLGNRQLNNMLLLNSLRQRHPFDVTWGADHLVRCYGMSSLVYLLQVALSREESDQVRGNVLDLLQELGYGFSAGLEDEVLGSLTSLLDREGLDAFGQVVDSHLGFIQEYRRQRDVAAQEADA